MKKYRVVLWMVETEVGLTKEQIIKMLDLLEDDEAGYMPIELEGECNSSAYGFICTTYYEEFNYDVTFIAERMVPVLIDWQLEVDSKEYELSDGTLLYMGCDEETL